MVMGETNSEVVLCGVFGRFGLYILVIPFQTFSFVLRILSDRKSSDYECHLLINAEAICFSLVIRFPLHDSRSLTPPLQSSLFQIFGKASHSKSNAPSIARIIGCRTCTP